MGITYSPAFLFLLAALALGVFAMGLPRFCRQVIDDPLATDLAVEWAQECLWAWHWLRWPVWGAGWLFLFFSFVEASAWQACANLVGLGAWLPCILDWN